MTDVIDEFVRNTFAVDLDIFLNALKLSPNAQGYIIGAISELLLKNHMESLGYELKRIKEKWEGTKHPNHRGDFYIRRKGTKQWFVLESKGVKSNSEKWHKLNSYSPLHNFLNNNVDKLKAYGISNIPNLINEMFPGLENGTKMYTVEDIRHKITVLETHLVSGAKSESSGRTIATPRRDEFHVVSLDLFLRTGKHQFIFANSKELKTSESDHNHLKQNDIVDVLIKNKKENLNIQKPWSENFDEIFTTLECPINEVDMQVDTRNTL